MNEPPTEAEVMGRGEPPPVFPAYGPDNSEHTFGTIGAWQAFMDDLIWHLFGEEDRLRAFLERNEDILNDLGQQPGFAKAVNVIRAQFAKALGEG